ncbi:hypothetical protein YH63_001650 [Afipia massiliensis]|uniref:DUF6538 domain-containing protein n=2 Tax=Afipia massiliensis TaxID=211460 RepID=A0A4U6BJG2_9BRAD|nr:DUF6538 domain-containing protein [Afipia massiliensis]TKT70227.1 hypothetical protein YH63_001650 [Afipia massiliensis]
MYYWRRRLPNALASWFHKRHLFLSPQTPEPNFARRLVVLLDAKLEEVLTARACGSPKVKRSARNVRCVQLLAN